MHFFTHYFYSLRNKTNLKDNDVHVAKSNQYIEFQMLQIVSKKTCTEKLLEKKEKSPVMSNTVNKISVLLLHF